MSNDIKQRKGTGLLTGGLVFVALSALLAGCNSGTDSEGAGTSGGAAKVSGEVSADGSSTVAPIMEAVAEEIQQVHPDIRMTVATSGTGGGMKKFVNGEIDIANASRPIEADEVEQLKAKGIEFVELPIAYDGLSVVVNPSNDFVDALTVEELRRIWEPNSTVKTWSDVRPSFPNEPIKLYGAGTDSGTFEYFTEAIVGKKKQSRADYQASEDDNVLVTGVAGDKYALGYFGFAYYDLNQDKLKVLKIDNGTGGIAPSAETIENGTYQPLSRPLFIYINKNKLDQNPAVAEVARFLLTDGRDLVKESGYIPLPEDAYRLVLQRLENKTTGTAFHGVEVGVRVQDVLGK